MDDLLGLIILIISTAVLVYAFRRIGVRNFVDYYVSKFKQITGE